MKKIILSLSLIFIFASNALSEITYLEILKNPTDLKLNLQYAKEQESRKYRFKIILVVDVY